VGANVLCHIPDLNALARSLDVLLDAEGIFIFEDPYLLEIITQLGYDQIYDEHYFYFSVLSLSRLFAAHGLRIFRVQALPVHGGSMRVYGCRAGAQRATEPGVETQLALERQHGLHLLQTYVDFAERVRQSRAALFTLLYNLKQSGRRIAGYAASSKGTVVLNYCGIGPQLLDYICDNTPGKQGLYAPGTHIPVLPIEHFAADRPDYAFVLAWNHMREIIAKEQAFTQAGGRFITHIPNAAIV
jgi:methylation protein EvaC